MIILNARHTHTHKSVLEIYHYLYTEIDLNWFNHYCTSADITSANKHVCVCFDWYVLSNEAHNKLNSLWIINKLIRMHLSLALMNIYMHNTQHIHTCFICMAKHKSNYRYTHPKFAKWYRVSKSYGLTNTRHMIALKSREAHKIYICCSIYSCICVPSAYTKSACGKAKTIFS